jgi:probable HAF family extracellular repeat protein
MEDSMRLSAPIPRSFQWCAQRLLVVAVVWLVVSPVAIRQPAAAALTGPSSVTDLGTLPGGTSSAAYAVNDQGQIVGYSSAGDGGNHAVLFANGTVTDLGRLPDGLYSYAYGINSAGQIVGASTTSTGANHAVLYQGGAVTDLGVLPGGDYSIAADINDQGTIVGYSNTATGAYHAYAYAAGVMTDLGTLPGGSDSYATSITNDGRVIGYASVAGEAYHAFLFANGTMTDLGTPAGDNWSFAYAINAQGQIAGYSSAPARGNRAFSYANGTMTALAALPGDDQSHAYGINDQGQVVGSSSVSEGQARAVVYENGTTTDLNDLRPAGFDVLLATANGINNLGQIVGVALVNWQEHAFVLQPDTRQAASPDTSAPVTTTALSPAPNPNGWNNRSVTVALSAADDSTGTGVKQLTYSASGAQPSATKVVARTTTTVTISVAGTTTIHYFATDNAGNVETTKAVTVKVDVSAPVRQAPSSSLPATFTLGTNAVSVSAQWSATDNPSGVAGYEVRQRQDSGSFATVSQTTGTSAVYALAPRHTYQFQMRATDRADNVSTQATGPSFTLDVVQENVTCSSTVTASCYTFAGRWTRTTLSGAAGGQVQAATAAGASATFAFSGTSVGLVTTKGPDRGKLEFWVDGVKRSTVDLYASTVTARQVVAINGLLNGAHTVTVKVLGTRNAAATGAQVDVDGFVVVR